MSAGDGKVVELGSAGGTDERRFPRMVQWLETARRRPLVVALIVTVVICGVLIADLLTSSFHIMTSLYFLPLALSAVLLGTRRTAYFCALALSFTALVLVIQRTADAEHVVFFLLLLSGCAGLVLLAHLIEQMERLWASVLRRARFAEAVARVVELSGGRAEIQAIESQAVRSAIAGTGAPAAALFLADGERWVCASSQGGWDLARGDGLPSGLETAVARTLAGERAVLLDAEPGAAGGVGAQGVALVPLRAFGRDVGMFLLEPPADTGSFMPDSVRFAENLAGYTGSALENARLVEELSLRERDLSLVLASSLDFATSLELPDVLRSIEGRLMAALDLSSCEICAVDVEGRRLITLAAVDMADPERGVTQGQEYDLDEQATSLLALASSTPVVIEDDTDPRLGPAERQRMAERGYAGSLTVQLRAHDALIGVVRMHHRTPKRQFTAHEIELAQAVARFAGLSVENAQLFSAQRDAAERNALLIAQLRRLLDISLKLNRLRGRPSIERVLTEVVHAGTELLAARRVAVATAGQPGRTAVVHVASESVGRPGENDAAWVERLLASPRPEEVAGGRDLAVPIVGTPLGERSYLLLQKPPGVQFSAEEKVLATTLGVQLAAGLTNTRAYQREFEIAETLQSAFRPQMPEVEGLEIAARYVAGTKAASVGGDFYDLLALSPQRLMVVVGDVCGKGLEVAAQTALVRYMLRAYVGESSPGESLARLNAAIIGQGQPMPFATLVLAYLDVEHRVLQFAVAGHPRPMLMAGGHAVRVPQGGGLPIGIEPAVYETHRLVVPPDAVLVLFTDGLTEARRQGQLFGERRVQRLLRLHAARGVEATAQALLDSVRRYTGGVLEDDAAVVAIGMK